MKKVAGYLILGLLLAFLLDRAGAVACDWISGKTHYRLFELYGRRIEPQVVVVGNSRAMQSVNGRILSKQLGAEAYNAGINGSPPEFVCALAKDAIEAHSSIKTVLIEASCFWPISANVDIKPVAWKSPRMYDILRRQDPLAAKFIKLSHLYAYNSEAFLRALFFLRNSDQDSYSTGVITTDIINAPIKEQYASKILPEYRLLLDDLQSFVDSRGIRLVLFVAPYHKSARARFPDFDALLTGIRNEEHEVWDFSESLVDDENFADRLHLNGMGAGRFSILLAEAMSTVSPAYKK